MECEPVYLWVANVEVSRNVEGTFPSVLVIAHMPRQSIPNRKFSESVDKLIRLSWLFPHTEGPTGKI